VEPRTTRGHVLLEHGLLAALAAALTLVAWRVYPAWDDGWLWLQRLEGDATIRASMADRPLLGWIWASLAEAGLLLPVSAAVHWVAWLGLGLVSRALWRRSFPDRASLGLVAGVLPLSTVVLELQSVLVNPVWGGLLGVVTVWAAALWLTAEGSPSRASTALRSAGAATAVGAACLLSEYGVVAAGVVAVALIVGGSPARPAAWRPALVVVGSALAGYAALLLVGDPAVRPEARPDRLLDLGLQRALATPFVVVTEFWQGLLGNLLRRAGEVEAESLESLTILAGSALAAAAAAWLAGRGTEQETPSRASCRPVVALLAAAAAGLLVMAVAARVPWSGPSSRYYMPVVPALACLAVWLVRRLVASPRVAAAAVIFVAAIGTVQDLAAAIAERRRVAEIAPLVVPHLDHRGFTVVVLVQPGAMVSAQRASGHELTARIAQDVPPPLRRLFWAVRAEALASEGVTGVKLLAPLAPDARLERRVRGLGGRRAISRVVWVEMKRKEGAVRVVVSEPS
jgi:hypothetical protein